MDSKKRVLLLCGGRSSEHPISVRTARNVLEAIDKRRYEVFLVGITDAGQWIYIPDRRFEEFLQRDGDGLEYITGAAPQTAYLFPTPQADAKAVLCQLPPGFTSGSRNSDVTVKQISAVDVVFPLLHGPYGEDGVIQGFLDTLGVPYVGSGVLASAIGMDKQVMKIVFEAAGIRISPYTAVTAEEYRNDKAAVTERIRSLRLPVFVKPARAGSSLGITRLDDLSELEGAMETAYGFDTKVIVEQAVEGQEIEVAVLQGRGRQEPRVTVPGEIVVQEAGKGYDFNSKYLGGKEAQLLIPAKIGEDAVADIQRQAGKAFTSIECKGLSRVDFFYTDEGAVVLNEINTMPGFTEISMYPKLWEASGVAYSALIDELITLALDK